MFRDLDVGTDNVIYIKNFNSTTMNPDTWSMYTDFEPGFAFFMAFFKTYICNNYLMFMGVVFFFYFICVNIFIRKTSPNAILSLFFLLSLLFYTRSFNIMRQSLAMGLACLAVVYLINTHRYILYYCSILCISILFHKTIVIFLFVPFFMPNGITNFIFNKNIIIYALLIISFFLISHSELITQLLLKITPILGDKYVNYANASLQIIDNTDYSISTITAGLNVLFAIYTVKITPNYLKYNVYYRLHILSVILFNFLGAASELFIRLSFNFQIFQIIYFAILWYKIPKNQSRSIYRFVVIIYGLVLFTNAMIKNYGFVVPYQFQ